jgi:hypothetical protein
MEFDIIIDSHSHWGPSITLGTDVTTGELQMQMKGSGIDYVAVIPFPSTAIENNSINVRMLEESKRVGGFIPYHYIREDYDREGFDPIPEAYCGGKWHWMRGWQDSASNYKVLEDKLLPELVDKIRLTGKPVIFEEELSFTERFVDIFDGLTLIIPHLGLLGGNPYDFLRSFKDKENIYFDTALSSKDTIHDFVKTIGPERVLFGSDVPFGSMKSELSKVLSLPIPEGDKELLLSKNFIRLTRFQP